MAVNSAEEDQDAYSISVLPAEATTDLQCETQLAFLNHSQVPNQSCLDAQLKCHNNINLEKETADAHSPCILDIYVENGNSGTPKNSDKAVERLKIESPLPRALQGQISLQIGVKFMQLLMNGTVVLPRFTSRDKSATERSNETPNNRTRKYKRSASFNSRRVVLLFSVVSSVGTLVLIYLTLRVRQIGDGKCYNPWRGCQRQRRNIMTFSKSLGKHSKVLSQ